MRRQNRPIRADRYLHTAIKTHVFAVVFIHQEFQVPKMEVPNLMFSYFGGGFSMVFPYRKTLHTAYICELYPYFKYQRNVW